MENSPIIVALDGMDSGAALRLAERLRDKVWGFKAGDLVIRYGVTILRTLREFGHVMADLKLHDIPHTVQNMMELLVSADADLITVHACGGIEMMRAANAVRRHDQYSTPARLFAVTILTSLDEENAHLIYGQPLEATVLQFARWAMVAGCRGIVSSPQELAFLARHEELKGLERIVPGIRPAWTVTGDQKRVMTPKEAMTAGAKYLVIGRPVYEHNDPAENVNRILDEIALYL